MQTGFKLGVFGHAPGDFLLQPDLLPGSDVAGAFQFKLGLDANAEDRGVDRLGDVVDGTFLDAPLLIVRIIEGGNEYHRNIAGIVIATQDTEHLMAIHIGHHDVEQDEIWPGGQSGVTNGDRSAVGNPDVHAKTADHFRNGAEVVRHIIDDQYNRLARPLSLLVLTCHPTCSPRNSLTIASLPRTKPSDKMYRVFCR